MTLLLLDIVEISFSSSYRGLGLWHLTPLSTTFQLYCGDLFYWLKKIPTYRKLLKTLSHIVVSSTHRHERDSNSQLSWW